MGNGSFPGAKRRGRVVDHPPHLSADVKERVELYIYSPFGLSWPVLGWTFPLPFIPIIIYSLTYSCSTFLEKTTAFPLVKKLPASYGTRMFITAFTIARHLSLSWVSSIHSMPLHHTPWRSILILSSLLRLSLPSGLFPSGFPTKFLYTPLFFPTRATFPAYLILLDLITPNSIGWAVQIITFTVCYQDN